MLLRLFGAREGDDYRAVLKGRCVLFVVFLVLGFAPLAVFVVFFLVFLSFRAYYRKKL